MAQMYIYKVISFFFFSFSLQLYHTGLDGLYFFLYCTKTWPCVCVCVSVCARSSSAAGTRLSIHQNYLSMKISIRLHRAGPQFSLSLFLSPTSLYAVHRVKEYREKEQTNTCRQPKQQRATRPGGGCTFRLGRPTQQNRSIQRLFLFHLLFLSFPFLLVFGQLIHIPSSTEENKIQNSFKRFERTRPTDQSGFLFSYSLRTTSLSCCSSSSVCIVQKK